MGLEDYKDIVATSAAVTTMVHMLSGTLICKDIYRKGTSKGVDPMPFLGGVSVCILMLRYAWILQDPTMINVNVFGLLTNMVYLAVYCFYLPHMADIKSLMGKAAALVVVFLAYAQLEHPDKVEFRFGLITTALLLLLIAAPLRNLGEVIKTKDASILPFPLVFMGTLLTFQWLLYGLIIDNHFIIVQNAVGFILTVGQLFMFVIFPSKPASKKGERKDD